MRGLRSAGILPFRYQNGFEVMIAHPGGPYFARRDLGWWSLVKGLVKTDETDEQAARREFEEETGWDLPPGVWLPLGETQLRSRKVVVAWALEAELDPENLDPGHFSMGDHTYPEIDRVEWFGPDEARIRLNTAQSVFIDRLEEMLQNRSRTSE